MSYKKITYQAGDDIGVITLTDPGTLNAISLDMSDELMEALEHSGVENRATVLTGAGKGFCSGANLASPAIGAQRTRYGVDAGHALETHYNPLIMAMKNHPHPLITAVNGAAAGVGCAIALMGDMIIASDKAYFLQAFRRIGLVPDGGSTYLLPRLIGRARAMEMALMGEKIHADKAHSWGLINDVVPADALMDQAMEKARFMATGPTQALSFIRALMWDSADRNFEGQLQAERLAQRTAGRSEDFKEGVTAFLKKRPAKFTGK